MAQRFSEGERGILEALDRALGRVGVRREIDVIVARVERKLADDAEALLAWEPIPLETYGAGLPEMIRSSWVFVLRGRSASGAERHPNSHQRMTSYRGGGDLQVWQDEGWRSNLLASERRNAVEERWVSIPTNVWHQAVVTEGNWVVVSFHTVPANELIEERGDPAGEQASRQRTYV